MAVFSGESQPWESLPPMAESGMERFRRLSNMKTPYAVRVLQHAFATLAWPAEKASSFHADSLLDILASQLPVGSQLPQLNQSQ